MSLCAFLEGLLGDGRVHVPDIDTITVGELESAKNLLRAFETQYRLSLAATPPPLSLPAALWASTIVYRACQLLIFPVHRPEQIERLFSHACPDGPESSVAYSADLTMRFLPDLLGRARSITLIEQLQRLARQWPLSSVGISEVGPIKVGPIVEHPSLLCLYVDRIIERLDLERLADCRVLVAARKALGLFPGLAAEIAAAIDSRDSQEVPT